MAEVVKGSRLTVVVVTKWAAGFLAEGVVATDGEGEGLQPGSSKYPLRAAKKRVWVNKLFKKIFSIVSHQQFWFNKNNFILFIFFYYNQVV